MQNKFKNIGIYLLVAYFTFFAASAFTSCAVVDLNDTMVEEGRVVVAQNGGYIFVDEKGAATVMNVRDTEKDIFSGLESGDRISIVRDVHISETYLPSVSVYECTLLEKGALSDIPLNTRQSLADLGWLSQDAVFKE